MNKCIDCRYCHKLKQLVNKEWLISSVCTLFPEIEPNSRYDDFAIVVDAEKDHCEMFTSRSK